MKTGVIGAGRIGTTLARLLAVAGHEVRIANASGGERLAALVAELGPAASAGSAEQVAREADLVVLMVPFGSARTLLPPTSVSGKVLVDAMNAFAEGGVPLDLGGRGSSELVAEWYPSARLVKSLNTMYFKTLGTAGRTDVEPAERLAHYVAGDDPGANKTVVDLIYELGFAPVATGSLRTGGLLQQPGGPLFNKPLTERQSRAVLGF
ncbi:NADPH-dependent F420 reductase [Streptomyces sp. NPDC001165]|uniref:NADPH-dependent F420 reductase n=1 Tax=Streptomyces sp. NPDC001165 TaxID=3364546 RepID=UPI0036AFAD5F